MPFLFHCSIVILFMCKNTTGSRISFITVDLTRPVQMPRQIMKYTNLEFNKFSRFVWVLALFFVHMGLILMNIGNLTVIGSLQSVAQLDDQSNKIAF